MNSIIVLQIFHRYSISKLFFSLENLSIFYLSIKSSELCIKDHCIRNIKNLLERSLSAFDINIIWIAWKYSKITFIRLANRCHSSVHSMNSISSQKVNIFSSLKILLLAFSIHLVSVLKSSISFEKIANSYLFHINKNLVSFASEMNRISVLQNSILKIVVSQTSKIFFDYHSSAFKIKIISLAWEYSRITSISLSIIRLSLVSTMTSEQQKLKISTSNRCQ